MTDSASAFPTTRQYRWLLCFLLFLITVNNYMDRQLLSIVAPVITTEFKLTASDLALIINAFLLAYGIGQAFSGRFLDWIGPKKGLSLSVLIWSLAGIFTSLSRGVLAFSSFRFALGAAESGNFPGGVKVLAEWFPSEERTTAVGVFTSGVSLGALLTPPLAAYMISYFGWQFAFVAVGLPGLLWILVWQAVYRSAPSRVNPTSTNSPQLGIVAASQRAVGSRKWSFLLRQRLAWAVILARFVEEPVGWLFYSWLPLYITKYLGATLMNTGFLLMIPFIAQDIGFILGGWAASHFMKRGWSVDRSRKCLIFLSGLCMTSSIVSIAATTPLSFVLLISAATFGHGSWSSNVISMPSDIVPYEAVGTLYGLSGFGGALGSMLFTTAIGRLVDVQHSFHSVFIIGGILPLAAAFLMTKVGGKIQRLPCLELGTE